MDIGRNTELPGGVQGGVIEAVKRAVMVALKDQLTNTTLDGVSQSEVSVEMEYPATPETYPGIWVQFNFTKFVNSGVGFEQYNRVVENEGEDNEVVRHELTREFTFEGTVRLTIVALTNLERDRLSDAVVTMLMFARAPEYVLTKPDEDTKQFRQLLFSLTNNPYVKLAINTDTIQPGGQSVLPGVPWDDEDLQGYEDNYSFDIYGQSDLVFRNDGTYTLREIVTTEDMVDYNPFEWN